MRASSRRAQNSSARSEVMEPGRNRPRRAKPSASSRASAIATPDSRQAGGLGQLGDRGRAAAVQVAAEHVGRGFVAVSGRSGRNRARMVRDHGGVREQDLGGGTAFHRAPQLPGRAVQADRPPVPGQLPEPGPPLVGGTHGGQGHQQVMQLVGAAGVRADLLGDPVDGGGIEPAQLVGFDGQAAAQWHRAAAALFQRRVVEEGERPPVEDLVREHGGLGGVPHDDGDPARLDRPDQLGQAVDVHGLTQAVLERLADQDMVGNLQRSGRHVLLAGGQRREDRGHQVVGLHPLDGRRVLLPAAHPQHGQGAVQVPPPARREHRGGEHRLPDHAFHRPGGQEPRHLVQRETVLRPEGQQDRVVTGRGLQLEVEGDAEPLAQRQPESPVEPGPERRVPDQLHPAAVVEEPFQHDGVHVGEHPELGQPGAQVGRDRVRGGLVDPALGLQPGGRGCPPGPGGLNGPGLLAGTGQLRGPGGLSGGQPLRHRLPDGADLLRQLDRAAGGLAEPERDRRRRALGVDHPHHARLDPADPPRGRAEQEHVAGHGLDRPVLVHRPDQGLVRLGQHPEVTQLRDRPARGERRETGAPAAGQPPATRSRCR